MEGKTRILAAGGAGYIGSHVVRALAEMGFEVLTYDNLSTGDRRAVLHGGLVEADLSDAGVLEKVLADFRPFAVMHFAASTVVPESVEDPGKYYQNNTANLIGLLDAMLGRGVMNIVFTSTAAVYGVPPPAPVGEDAPMEPINPYGSSKMMSEVVLRDLASARGDFRYVSLRCFNVAGSSPDLGAGRTSWASSGLVARAVKAACGGLEKLQVFGTDYPTHDGTCVRDYVHVEDVAEAHLLALGSLAGGSESGVFNCGRGRGHSVGEVVEAARRVTGRDFRVEDAGRRRGDPPVMVAETSSIRETLGWKPGYDDLDLIIRTEWEWELKRLGESAA
jgi:UDP-glucose 4-epimerase